MSGNIRALFRDTLDLLVFKLPAERVSALGWGHLYLGLMGTWIAGIGRYWDHPKAEVVQMLGLGSLGYVFVMSALLWCVFRPVAGCKASYWGLVTFVALTSFPAWLYAIPVERFMSIGAAIRLNVLFLAVVASWRLALLFRHARLAYGLGWGAVFVCCLLPVMAIIVLLATLNLEHAVFEIMGGFREPTSGDGAYLVMLLLSFVSTCLFPVLLLVWLWLVVRVRRAAKPQPNRAKPI